MRALILRQCGDPKQMKVEEVPTPVPAGDEVLVEVRAAAINPSDVIYRKQLRVLGVDSRKLDAVACAKLLAEMSPHFASGAFAAKPGVPRPLNQAVEAYEQTAQGGVRILLLPNE